MESVLASLQTELANDKYGFFEYVKRGILVPGWPLLSLRAAFEEKHGDCNFFAYFTEQALQEAVDKGSISILLINIPYRTIAGTSDVIQHTVTRLKEGHIVGFSGYDRLILGERGTAKESDLKFLRPENIRGKLSVEDFEKRFHRMFPPKFVNLTRGGISVDVVSKGSDAIPVIENNVFPAIADGVMRYLPDGAFIEVGVRGAKSSEGSPGVAFKYRVVQDSFDEDEGIMVAQGELIHEFVLPLKSADALREWLQGRDEGIYDGIASGEGAPPVVRVRSTCEGEATHLRDLAAANEDILAYLLNHTVVGMSPQRVVEKLRRMAKAAAQGVRDSHVAR